MRSSRHTQSPTVDRKADSVDSQIEGISTSLIRLDTLRYHDSDPKAQLKHARSIENRAKRLVKLLK